VNTYFQILSIDREFSHGCKNASEWYNRFGRKELFRARNDNGITVAFRNRQKKMNRDSQIAGQQVEPDVLSRITTALDNPLWDFRTVEGIAKETGLSNPKIEEVLEGNPSVFRKSPVTDEFGRSLFALASHPIRWRERLAVLQSALKGEVVLC
jgi:hypothetical protein